MNPKITYNKTGYTQIPKGYRLVHKPYPKYAQVGDLGGYANKEGNSKAMLDRWHTIDVVVNAWVHDYIIIRKMGEGEVNERRVSALENHVCHHGRKRVVKAPKPTPIKEPVLLKRVHYPFSLKAAHCGVKVLTRAGKHVSRLEYVKETQMVGGTLGNKRCFWNMNGKCDQPERDLFLVQDPPKNVKYLHSLLDDTYRALQELAGKLGRRL